MAKEKIQGGFYIKAKRIRDSDIAHAPPHIREIWDYFLREANHHGIKKRGLTLKRGQLLVTYDDIREALHWKVGWRKQYYTRAQCETAMKFLRKEDENSPTRTTTRTTTRTAGKTARISTRRTGRGIVVTILNYDYYQDLKNYENHRQQGDENHKENHKESHKENQSEADDFGSDDEVETAATKRHSPCPVKKIVELYHTILPELPKCVEVEGVVAQKITTRWREKKVRQNLEWWQSYFENRVRTSDFLMGRKTNFQATLFWLTGPQNMTKVLNGQYSRNNGGRSPAPTTYGQHLDDERRRKVQMLLELDNEQPPPENSTPRIDAP